jgi:hypothetical protein
MLQEIQPLSESDRELLEFIAREIASEIDGILVEAEAVNVATFPVPVIEIEYPGYLVSLALSVDHDEEERDA